MEFKISFVTTLPIEGNCPSVKIISYKQKYLHKNFTVHFYDLDSKSLIRSEIIKINQECFGFRQWYTNWSIEIYDNEENKLIHQEIFNLKNKIVFIKIDAYALGDNIAWIPFVEAFREKHKCIVICSTFFNDIFKDSYKNILFVKPNTIVENVYAQYYIGANTILNEKYSPINVNEHSLQDVAAYTLGIKKREIKTNLTINLENIKRNIEEKYVCISEFGSNESKHWKLNNGWQNLVDYINNKGYKVLVISKESTNLQNVINLTGNIPLDIRMIDLFHSELYIGVSSGLSWLSWSVNTHVLMISDVTHPSHEFKSDITRLCANKSLIEVDYNSKEITTLEEVFKQIDILL